MFIILVLVSQCGNGSSAITLACQWHKSKGEERLNCRVAPLFIPILCAGVFRSTIIKRLNAIAMCIQHTWVCGSSTLYRIHAYSWMYQTQIGLRVIVVIILSFSFPLQRRHKSLLLQTACDCFIHAWQSWYGCHRFGRLRCARSGGSYCLLPCSRGFLRSRLGRQNCSWALVRVKEIGLFSVSNAILQGVQKHWGERAATQGAHCTS